MQLVQLAFDLFHQVLAIIPQSDYLVARNPDLIDVDISSRKALSVYQRLIHPDVVRSQDVHVLFDLVLDP